MARSPNALLDGRQFPRIFLHAGALTTATDHRSIADADFLIVLAATSYGFAAVSAGSLEPPSEHDFRVDRWVKKPYLFVRVSPYEPTVTELQEFTGIFRSAEIEMPYEVAVKDDHLVTRALKTEDVVLHPVAPDLFARGDSRVRFTGDAQGHVSGALFNTERTRNLRYERVMQ
jgi:hypothetical protein